MSGGDGLSRCKLCVEFAILLPDSFHAEILFRESPRPLRHLKPQFSLL
jgi:hypothetical protein